MERDEWLKKRRKVITATEAASLLGLNPYKSIKQIWFDKNNKVELVSNSAMEDGTDLEPAVLRRFKRHMKLKEVELFENMFISNKILGASPDAMIKDKGVMEGCIVELKTTKFDNLQKWRHMGPPIYYLIQLYTQELLVRETGFRQGRAERDTGYLACMVPLHGLPFIVYKVSFQDRLFVILLNEAARFWENPDEFRVNSNAKKEARNLLLNQQYLDKVIDTEYLMTEDLF